MDENKIRQIVREEMNAQKGIAAFSTVQVPNHTHNGSDSPKIAPENLLDLTIYGTSNVLVMLPPSFNFQIRGVYNATRLSLKGLAANNASDITATATKKAIVNGEVNFGKAYPYALLNETVVSIGQTAVPYTQTFNSMYIGTTAASARTKAGGDYLVNVTDDAGTTVATLRLVNYENDVLMFEVVLDSAWQISAMLTIY